MLKMWHMQLILMKMMRRKYAGWFEMLKIIRWHILIVLGIEHATKKIKKFIGDKSIKVNIFKIKENYSIVRRYVSIEFIDLMFNNKRSVDSTSLSSPHNLKKMIKSSKNNLKAHEINILLTTVDHSGLIFSNRYTHLWHS